MALVAAVDKVRRAVLLGAATSSGGSSRRPRSSGSTSMDAAAFLRVRIRSMLVLGELLFLLGITPFGLITSGTANIRAVAGPGWRSSFRPACWR